MVVLKKTRTMFFQAVARGEIPYETQPGHRRGKLFPKEAIDYLAKAGTTKTSKEPLSLVPQTVAELWQSVSMTKALYGEENTVPFTTMMEWRDANPDIYMSLKEGTKLVGEVTFLPLEEKTALALIYGKIKDKDISPYTVRKWTENNLSVYIPTIEVLPSGNKQRDRERGTFLLRHTIKWGVLLTMQHDIKNWYAVGATPEGKTILQSLGFSKVSEFDHQWEGYMLETKKEPVRLIGMYLREIDSEKTA